MPKWLECGFLVNASIDGIYSSHAEIWYFLMLRKLSLLIRRRNHQGSAGEETDRTPRPCLGLFSIPENPWEPVQVIGASVAHHHHHRRPKRKCIAINMTISYSSVTTHALQHPCPCCNCNSRSWSCSYYCSYYWNFRDNEWKLSDPYIFSQIQMCFRLTVYHIVILFCD